LLIRNDKYECKFAPKITEIGSMQEVM
jgi:hypothetical protein